MNMQRMTDWMEAKLPSPVRQWLNIRLDVRRKHALLALSSLMFTVVGFWHQSAVQAESACNTSNEARANLKAVMLYMVDLTDVLPNDKSALLYTTNRKFYINTNKALLPKDCGRTIV